jgi:toxin ParE1/3/4
MKIRWLDTAVFDLKNLRQFIATENPGAASRVAKKIINSVNLLSEHPEMGRPGRIVHTRELIIPEFPYIVPYRIKAGFIEIIRVFHCAREWPENF